MGKSLSIDNNISISNIKNKSIEELINLASDIRKFLLENVSKTGGHLSSNLGVVEATIALHYVFNSPTDKIIFDVGHQGYVHKILTGRADKFSHLRSMNGVSGFLKYSESPHDVFEAGHSSTSISALCGFLEEKENNPEIGEVVAFIGDASIQNGLALSSLNYLASKTNQKGIIIINDNEMSISKNSGGLTNIFNKIRIRKSYSLFRKITPKSIKSALKTIVYGKERLFSQLGFTYIGPIDGHNIKDLIKYFEFAKNNKKTTIIHIKTVKGKGYEPAEKDILGEYHSIGPFDLATGKVLSNVSFKETPFNAGIAKIIDEFFNKYSNIKLIIPAMVYGLGFSDLQKKYPKRVIDCGICEENAVIMASSISRVSENKTIPIVATYATFFQRAYDEINHDVTRANNHVIFLADRAGIVPGDGDTHQGIFDISMLYSLPNLIICAPSDLNDFYEVFSDALQANSPFYIRYPKVNISSTYSNTIQDNIKNYRKWKIINNISEKNILTYGPVVTKLKDLIQDKDIGLINCLYLNPIDIDTLLLLKNTSVYIYEEVISTNSLSSKIYELNYKYKLNLDIHEYNLTNYVTDGSLEELYSEYHLELNTLLDDIQNKH